LRTRTDSPKLRIISKDSLPPKPNKIHKSNSANLGASEMPSKHSEIKLRPSSKQNENGSSSLKESSPFNNNSSTRSTITMNKTSPREQLANKPPITASNQSKMIKNIETNKAFSRSFENPSVLTNKQDVNINNNRNSLNFKPYYDQMTNQIYMNSIPNASSNFLIFS
jgi:hypothetical protein